MKGIYMTRPSGFEKTNGSELVKAARHTKREQDVVTSVLNGDKKSANNMKKGFLSASAILLVAAGVVGWNKYNDNLKKSEVESAVSVALDHQGVVFNSVKVESDNEIITSVPASQDSSNPNSYNFYTKWLPGHKEVELYQKLTTAGGQTYNVYPITNLSNEIIAVKAFSQLQAQPK